MAESHITVNDLNVNSRLMVAQSMRSCF